jgi:ribosomal-protein-alanine N-acetyltransferase
MTFEGILRKHLYTKGEHQDVKMYSIIKDEE